MEVEKQLAMVYHRLKQARESDLPQSLPWCITGSNRLGKVAIVATHDQYSKLTSVKYTLPQCS